MKLTPQQKLDRMHVSLLRDDRTLILSGILMMGTSTITNSPALPTAATDGINKMYDEKFFSSMDEAEARTLIVHENLHCMFKHTLLWKKLWDLNARKANMAADYVVNGFIVKLDPSGTFLKPVHKKPGIWLQDDKYDNMDVSEVFRLLPDDPQGEGEGEGEDGTPGQPGNGKGRKSGMQGLDGHDWEKMKAMDAGEIEEICKEIDQAIRQGAIVAGKMSANKNRTFDALMEPKVDWRKVLREFVAQHCDGRDEATWRRPNRRHLQYDMYLPSMQGVATGDVVVAIDTSGSTYVGGMLEKFMSELNAITLATQPEKTHVLYWEHTVAAHEVYTRDELGGIMAATRPKGGGGTTTSCVTAYMKAHSIKPKVCVVCSDGYVGDDWGGEWPCPVMWVILGNKNAQPPVGIVVHAED